MSSAPNESAMRQHLDWITTGAPIDYRFEIAWGLPDQGPNNARTFRLDDVASGVAAATQTNLAGNNVYVSVTLKSPSTPAYGRTRKEHSAVATCLTVDFDNQFISGARRLGSIARPQLIVLTGTRPSLRAQLWLRITPIYHLRLWDHATREIAEVCQADLNAVGLNRLMRLAGTVSYPTTAKRSRGYIEEVTQLISRGFENYSVGDLLVALPPREARAAPTNCGMEHRSLPANTVNIEILCSALRALPVEFAVEYSRWLRVGLALHHFCPGADGLKLWMRFSERCPDKAAVTNFESHWARFSLRRNASPVTIGSILYHARKAGWRAPRRWDRVGRIN